MSEPGEDAPGEESLATAKLRADVARQQMRLAKDQLKRARRRFKDARREARRARKLAAIARRAWKRRKRRGKPGDRGKLTTAAAAASVAVRRAPVKSRSVRKRTLKANRKSARATAQRRGTSRSPRTPATRRRR